MSITLVRGKYVIERVSGRNSVVIHEDAGLAVEEDRVLAVGAYHDLAQRYPDGTLLGSADHVVLPGLVNSHHHVGLTPVQLGSLDQPLELWFATRLAARNVDLYLDTLYSAFEMIESGVTTVQHLHARVAGPLENVEKAANQVLAAYKSLGMRVSYALGFRDQNRLVYEADEEFIRRLPADLGARLARWLTSMALGLDDYLAIYEALGRQHAQDPRVRIQLAPSNLHWVSDSALEVFRDFSEKRSVPMHMHLNETAYQRRYAKLRTGTTAVAHLRDLGLLGPRLTLGHAVWLTERDIEMVAETGTLVCHNASSNLRLRSGTACLNCYHARGVRVAMGIDEAGINDDRDMLSEMRLVLNLHRVPGMKLEDVPTAAQVLQMASENGGLTTPFGAQIGTLSPGAKADLALISWKSLSYPYLDSEVPVLDAVLQRCKSADVETVMIGGEVVMRDRRFTRVDKEAALSELAAQLALPLLPEEKRRRELAHDVLPYVRDFYADYLVGKTRASFYRTSARH